MCLIFPYAVVYVLCISGVIYICILFVKILELSVAKTSL